MRITLPSGAWVDVKDNMVPADRFAVQDSVETVIEDGRAVIRGAASSQWKAFLSRVVVAWSYDGVPIPSHDLAVLDAYPDTEDDADALEDALQDRYERVTRRRPTARPRPAPTSGISTSS